jgi:acetoacetyl-CoA synthetase
MDRTDVVPEVLWTPKPDRVEQAAITDFSDFVAGRIGRGFSDYGALWDFSTQDLAGFWSAVADYFEVAWHDRPAEVLPAAVMPGADWFPGGTLNYAEHALRSRPGSNRDGGLGDIGDGIAVIEVAENGSEQLLSLPHLRAKVGAAQAGLRRLGVGAGDRVVALVPNSAEALVGFLATAALGAVWSSCSPDFGAHSVIDRFTQISPTVLIAVDGYRYGGREFAVGDTVQKIREALPSLSGAVHVPALGTAAAEGMIRAIRHSLREGWPDAGCGTRPDLGGCDRLDRLTIEHKWFPLAP